MILKLKNANAHFPPGGFSFKDARTGYEVKGNAAMEQTADGLATKIIKVRRANPHLYNPSEAQWFDHTLVVQEIYAVKAQTHPQLFQNYQGNLSVPVVVQSDKLAQTGVKCPACASENVTGIKCKTCAGTRIKSYHCESCGKDWAK
jgi:predicted RNA-binding Zn-ribbon protein involved in translation (DUF1610 family)